MTMAVVQVWMFEDVSGSRSLSQSVTVVEGEFVAPSPSHSMRSLAEKQTVLPCQYRLSGEDELMVQVTWYKEKPDGTKEQIIAVHRTEGQTAFGPWSGRVRFKSSDPMVDSSLAIMSTEVSDEGSYVCHISVFPTGNFDRQLSLTVWTTPISSLEPVILVEGQSYGLAASCRSVARPLPRLSWDTDLNGQSTNRTSEGGSVSSHYSLHPLRSMNGKKLDCLVWHPALEQPRRLHNNLVVHYPPHAEVSGYNKNWYVGLETAALRCVSGGNPKPQSFTWTRKGSALPEGVSPQPNGTLVFGRPLRLSDAGVYQCEAANEVGLVKSEVDVTRVLLDNLLVIVVVAAAVGLLIMMVIIIIAVTCHHKRKNKKLEKELTEKKEEISTLSRQASFRRVNSVCTDVRQTEENIPLRVEGTLRTSQSSLGEQARSRDSRSTLSGGRGGGGGGAGGLDYLGRPLLHNSSRRGRERTIDRDEESRLRVESYVRNSTMSLQENRLHPPLLPTPFPLIPSTELLRSLNGSSIIPTEGGALVVNAGRNQQHSPMNCGYPAVTDEEDEEDEGLGGLTTPASQGRHDDQDSETNSSQVSDAQGSHYQQTNGTLRPKPHPNPMSTSPHASLIHKAQIV
ncbi:nectin-4 [Lampris incognitus]|uniref:nectin-4 n=1 Tax=Lampris incognitus TaxID=2546036 RepID=UPI0024B5E2F6|nr:nectin-4 [Lampris incognitus]